MKKKEVAKMSLTFKGGFHPEENKGLTDKKAIIEFETPKEVVIPLSQHIGAPANPIVAVGDQVLKGQKIAEAGGFVSAPIYSSVSGKVKANSSRIRLYSFAVSNKIRV